MLLCLSICLSLTYLSFTHYCNTVEVYIFRAKVTPYDSEWRKENVKHVFAHNLRERRLNLRQTKDKMTLGLFYKYRYVQYIAQKQVVLAIFVCLPVCHTPFVHSAL